MRSFLQAVNFSKREAEGVLALFLVLLGICFAPGWLHRLHPEPPQDMRPFQQEMDRFYRSAILPTRRKFVTARHVPAIRAPTRLFPFNPNGLPASQWMQLGLSAAQIRVIHHFEARGGRFFRKEDLKKIYSVAEEDYRRLEPYIRLPERPSPKSFSRSPAPVMRAPLVVELNSADSVALLEVKGIGPVFASRIIRYRNRLGGFYDVEQLREVYGMDSTKLGSIAGFVRVDATAVIRIDINSAGVDELRRHPYLSYKQINAIIRYREQHGPYNGPEELKNVVVLDEGAISRITPYLVFR